MTTVAVVFQSGKGHTKVLADAILKGINTVQGTNGDILEIRGCATYMGSASAIFKAFLEAAFEPQWLEQRWKDKIAAGFTNSASSTPCSGAGSRVNVTPACSRRDRHACMSATRNPSRVIPAGLSFELGCSASVVGPVLNSVHSGDAKRSGSPSVSR